MDYQLNDIVEMKKQHPCKKSNQWKIVRMGADIKIKCLNLLHLRKKNRFIFII